MRLALLVSHQTCSQDDEMTSEPHVSVAFTIDRIDVLLQNGPIPLPLHLSQPDIDINLLLCSTKQANQQRKGSFRERKKKTRVLGNRSFSTSLFTLLNKTASKSCASLDDFLTLLLFLLLLLFRRLLHLILMQKKTPHNPQLSRGTRGI